MAATVYDPRTVALGTPVVANAATLQRARIAWPSVIETVLTVAAVAAIAPYFSRVATDSAGRDRRYAEATVAVAGLAPPVLALLCTTHAGLAAPIIRERLCPRTGTTAAVPESEALPLALADSWKQTMRAFEAPLEEAQSRLAELRARQREGLGDLLQLSNAIEAIDAEAQPFIHRYALERSGGAGPRPLACAFDAVSAGFLRQPGSSRVTQEARANVVLLLAAALDGHAATAALAEAAPLPSGVSSAACATLAMGDALARGAALMADARQASLNRAKNDAMRELLTSAGWQWSAWMLAGLALLKLSRSRLPAAVGIALALLAGAAAAWAGRVPWPLATDRAFEPGRVAAPWNAMPSDYVLALLGAALVVLALSGWLRRRLASGPQTLASRVGYPGFVVATGLGWLLLLDLSANAHAGNRYLALYHHGHLWLGMLVLTVLAFLRPALARTLGWGLSVLDELVSGIGRRLGPLLGPAALVLWVVVLVGAVGVLLSGIRQFTSELGRVWLIVGVAWFFFLRGSPVAERLARSGGSMTSLIRFAWPLAFIALVLVGVMFVTRDMGPLLIASYGAGAFLAASIAMWWHWRSGATFPAFAIAVGVFAAWLLATTLAVFQFGAIDDVTAGRLENLAAPLASANDQLALVTWFQRAAPAAGFGLGAVPWCGFAGSSGCAGVPAQIQSDYTFTAIVGAFGWTVAWAMTLGCALWLHRLIRHHGRVTSGEPRFIRTAGRVVSDDQAFLSWICVSWVVLTLCQLAVTVAGNLAVLPLTGVTFPFVSFGMTSLLVNMALLALCLNVNLPAPSGDG